MEICILLDISFFGLILISSCKLHIPFQNDEIFNNNSVCGASQVAQLVKNSPVNAGDTET